MNIINSQYSVSGKYLEIFLTGCKRTNKCKGQCHNISLWEFNQGTDWVCWQDKITNKIKEFNDVIDYVFVTGGEPLDQDERELVDLFIFLKKQNKPIVLFTSYSFKKISDKVKIFVDYIKCEPYLTDRQKKDVGICVLASDNQILYKKEPNGDWSCV